MTNTQYEAGDEILFEDIQKGDVIRRTVKTNKGTSIVTEGIAHTKTTWYWDTADGHTVCYDDDSEQDEVLITLVERPVPSLPTEVGTIIRAKAVRGTTGYHVLILNDKEDWRSAVPIEDALYGGEYYWHNPDRILEWEVMELVAKK